MSQREPMTETSRSLLDELSESPLPGARYARDVVARRLPRIEAECSDDARKKEAEFYSDLVAEAFENGKDAERARLREGVASIPVGCHSRSGLRCDEDAYGWCYLISRADVLALLEDPR